MRMHEESGAPTRDSLFDRCGGDGSSVMDDLELGELMGPIPGADSVRDVLRYQCELDRKAGALIELHRAQLRRLEPLEDDWPALCSALRDDSGITLGAVDHGGAEFVALVVRTEFSLDDAEETP